MLLFQPLPQQFVQLGGIALHQHRRHLCLRIDRAPRIYIAVHMDRQARNHRNRTRHVEQHALQATIGMAHVNAARQAQISVKPGANSTPP